jgi:5-methylthioadenosine/S-adenosylhomocysteine deaminase
MDWLSKRIWVMEAAHTQETLYISALSGISELLSSGTTCILDMGTVRHTDSIFKAVLETGIRANVGKCLMDYAPETPAYLRESTKSALEEAMQLYSQWNGAADDRIRVSFAPRFALSCTEELLKGVAALSKKYQAIIHTHASESRKEIELVKNRFGCENIEYLNRMGLTSSRLVLAHGVWLNTPERQILKNTGSHITHCPSSNLKLASGIAPIPELRAMGINVALGSDGAPCNNNLSIFNEMRLAALIHKPGHGPKTMTAMEVLDMATRDGAKALNWFDEIGSIEIGKKADLVALDLNSNVNLLPEYDKLNPESIASSIVYSSGLSHVDWTMVDGKIVYDKKNIKTADKTKLINAIRHSQNEIRRRSASLNKRN